MFNFLGIKMKVAIFADGELSVCSHGNTETAIFISVYVFVIESWMQRYAAIATYPNYLANHCRRSVNLELIQIK